MTADRITLISVDGHVGPRASDLRPYCESRHLDDFDAFMGTMAPLGEMLRLMFFGTEDALPPQIADVGWDDPDAVHRRLQTMGDRKGHYDPAARLNDLDRDGIAAEILFFGSQNGEWIPFERVPLAESILPAGMLPEPTIEQQGIGYHIYNRWLADFCVTAPDRFCGVAYIPFWDIDASVKEMQWAREHGLRTINFPTLREGIPAFNDPVWNPLWQAAVDLGMALSTHAGGAPMPGVDTSPGPDSIAIIGSIDQQWFSRRGVWWMVCSGVFERFPDLKLVLTELPGVSWDTVADEMDGVYGRKGSGLSKIIPQPPSEYFRTNCYLGLSFASRSDVELSLRRDWIDTFMWGCDYPHMESTWGFTTPSLNKTFEGLDESVIRKICGLNAAGVYGFDLDVLAPLAGTIGPALPALQQPFDRSLIPPESELGFAFRDGAYMS